MIIGIGTDLCDIRRIEKILNRYGERFSDRIYTENEKIKAAKRANPAAVYALCYAAKEACAKALGSGFRLGVSWRDISVGNLSTGQPYLTLCGGAEKRLSKLTPSGMRAQIDLTLSDEHPMAQAVVVISAIPKSEAP